MAEKRSREAQEELKLGTIEYPAGPMADAEEEKEEEEENQKQQKQKRLSLPSCDFFCRSFACVRLPEGQREMNHLFIAADPSGKYFLAGGRSHDVVVRHCVTGDEVSRVRGHAGSVLGAAWMQSANAFVTASTDASIRIWHADTLRPKAILHGHVKAVTFVAWDEAEETLVSASNDQRIILWNVHKFVPQATKQVAKGASTSICGLSLCHGACVVATSALSVAVFLVDAKLGFVPAGSFNIEPLDKLPSMSHTSRQSSARTHRTAARPSTTAHEGLQARPRSKQLSRQLSTTSSSSTATAAAAAAQVPSTQASTRPPSTAPRMPSARAHQQQAPHHSEQVVFAKQACDITSVHVTPHFVSVGLSDGRALVCSREAMLAKQAAGTRKERSRRSGRRRAVAAATKAAALADADEFTSACEIAWFYHPQSVTCVRLLLLRLMTGCADGSIRLFSMATKQCTRVFRVLGNSSPVRQFAFENLRSLVVSTDDALALLDFGTERKQQHGQDERAMGAGQKQQVQPEAGQNIGELREAEPTQDRKQGASNAGDDRDVVAAESKGEKGKGEKGKKGKKEEEEEVGAQGALLKRLAGKGGDGKPPNQALWNAEATWLTAQLLQQEASCEASSSATGTMDSKESGSSSSSSGCTGNGGERSKGGSREASVGVDAFLVDTIALPQSVRSTGSDSATTTNTNTPESDADPQVLLDEAGPLPDVWPRARQSPAPNALQRQRSGSQRSWSSVSSSALSSRTASDAYSPKPRGLPAVVRVASTSPDTATGMTRRQSDPASKLAPSSSDGPGGLGYSATRRRRNNSLQMTLPREAQTGLSGEWSNHSISSSISGSSSIRRTSTASLLSQSFRTQAAQSKQQSFNAAAKKREAKEQQQQLTMQRSALESLYRLSATSSSTTTQQALPVTSSASSASDAQSDAGTVRGRAAVRGGVARGGGQQQRRGSVGTTFGRQFAGEWRRHYKLEKRR